ncbi:hypothetical protein J2Z62_000734 [Mycoplasmoides fastidiosum]|uniref:Solute-binding protein family 5 domain-containing protein n=1 Tax=Mycoplasmoides fastidiosum TaxID=92758 RepID=A0ABU0M012_9BACT|nr:hypothetical protein [Mycoplasmoides fastidiosum]MDQ0514296.1 hypothetical protein [Mycoplasmoides fastidiosum]UUD38099.1 hypothetical protein NPA10_01800 [Mycoplasmoides fastidiosum]
MTTGALLSACSSTTLPHLRNEFYYKVNSNPAEVKTRAFDWDYTKSAQNKAFSNITPHLIEYKYSGHFGLDAEGKPTPQTNAKYKIAFALAKAIHVTTEGGKVEVFDSDAVDGVEPDGIQIGMMRETSTQSNSVNSPAFYEALRKATKVQFTVKEGIYWADGKGEKTSYQLKPEDFFTKYARTVMQNVGYRHAHGGSKEADDHANNVTYRENLEPNTNPFIASTDFGNEYLIYLFGVDGAKLTKKDSFLTTVSSTGEQAVTFEALTPQASTSTSGTSSNPSSTQRQVFFDTFMDKIILTGNYFTPAPTDFIKANQSRNPANVSGLAAEIGYYWYGAKFEEMLYAGPYFVTESNQNRFIYKMNPHYFDQEWVNDDSSVRSVVSENDGTDATSFRSQNFELYKTGQTPTISYNNLSQTQQAEVLNSVRTNPELFNLSYTVTPDYSGFNSLAVTWRPILYGDYQNPLVQRSEYAFNDAFALLMYDNTIADIEAGKVATSSKHYWTGDGYIFRSILSSAFNYYAFATEIGSELSHWSTLARPDTPLGGSDQSTTATFKHLSDDVRQTGFFFYGGADNKTKFEKTLAADQKHSVDNTNNQEVRYQASNYEQLKAETKRLLDKFYGVTTGNTTGTGIAKLTNNKHQKIQLTFNTRSSATTANRKSATENAVKVLNSLDPRLDIRVADWTQERFDALTNAKSPHTWNGWGYDVIAYAGFLGAFLYPERQYSWFTSLFHFADETTSSSSDAGVAGPQENFKEIRKLAKAFKASEVVFSKETGAESKTWEEMKNGTNKDWYGFQNFMRKDANSKYNPAVALTRFALTYANNLSNQELADLNYEITSLMGYALNAANGYQITRNAVPRLVNRHYEIPVDVNGDRSSYRYVRILKDA